MTNFKIGDRVSYRGEEGTVDYVYTAGHINIQLSGRLFYVAPEEMKFVTRSGFTQPTAPATPTPATFKTGDRVRYRGMTGTIASVYANSEAVNFRPDGAPQSQYALTRDVTWAITNPTPPAAPSNEGFIRAAVQAVNKAAKENRTLTTDDVWAKLGDVGTQERRQLGGVMIEMAKSGVIRNTGRFQKSTRKESHRRPIAVWESLVR